MNFFEQPILNSPYACPGRHWELGPDDQPTIQILERRRPAKLISPVPKSRKRAAQPEQEELVLGAPGWAGRPRITTPPG